MLYNKYNDSYRWAWSAVWLLVVDGDGALPFMIPLSIGGDDPHLPSDSLGSITLTDPSLNPTANWLGSSGWAAITRGYTAWLLQYTSKCQTPKHKFCWKSITRKPLNQLTKFHTFFFFRSVQEYTIFTSYKYQIISHPNLRRDVYYLQKKTHSII